jgi:hypothetical protein
MKKLLMIFLLILQVSLCLGQQVTGKEFINIKTKYFSNAVYADIYLPKNADKTGNTDYTDFLQKAVNENTKIIFPNFPVLVSDKGINLLSNQNILFQPKSKLILKSNDKAEYKVLNIKNIRNVKAYFLNIVGDKYTHFSDLGEWGHGISIMSSSNIMLYKPRVSRCWGDGIYIGQDTTVPQNIIVNGGFINDNRRNGISIISGINVTIKNITVSNTKGHNPQSGIDIEPNTDKNEITNVILSNITTKNNAVHGIVISTGNLNGSTKPISITLNNHHDFNSAIALGLGITRDNLNYIQPLKGKITINNLNYTLPGTAFIRNYQGKKNDVILSLKNMNFKRSNTSKAQVASALSINQFLSDYHESKNSDLK